MTLLCKLGLLGAIAFMLPNSICAQSNNASAKSSPPGVALAHARAHKKPVIAIDHHFDIPDAPDEISAANIKHSSKPITATPTPLEKGKEVAGTHNVDPQTMKLLVIAVDGTEPSYAAVTAFLDQIGIPYDTYKAICRLQSPACALPVFNTSATQSNYYGIILTVGNLYGCAGSVCGSSFSTSDWAALDVFTAAFKIRVLSYYTYPEPRYGFNWGGPSVSTSPTTTATPGTTAAVTLTPAASTLFASLNQTAQVPVNGAYMYFGSTISPVPAGETDTPILMGTYGTTSGVVGMLHTTATQQYLALTMDNAYFLKHSLVLSYGLINWVTKGMFLGSKKYYLTPQLDDLFMPDDMFVTDNTTCEPKAFLNDPVSNFTDSPCPTVRLTGPQFQTLDMWQKGWQGVTHGTYKPFASFKTTWGFNGVDVTGDAADTLETTANTLAGDFVMISHTFDHPNLDCYSLSTTNSCVPATYDQSDLEVSDNIGITTDPLTFGNNAKVFDSTAMITPEVSGLSNPNFLQAAWDDGIRTLVTDASKPCQGITTANVGIWIPLSGIALTPPCTVASSGIFGVPRFATSIFYNVDTAASGTGVVGSEVDEYNYFYGPAGISQAPGGGPWFSVNQTYSQIIDRESDAELLNILRGYAFPFMFHQTNAVPYSGSHSLYSDTIDSVLTKFSALMSPSLSITSQKESEIAATLKNRMAYNSALQSASFSAQWTPATTAGGTGSISLFVPKPSGASTTIIDLTGVICPGSLPSTVISCEAYGGQTIAHIEVTATTAQPIVMTTPQ